MPQGAVFVPVMPARLLDTRTGAPLGDDATRNLVIAGANGVPADAVGVALNVTGTESSSDTYLSVWPQGASHPGTSNLNLKRGDTLPNQVFSKLGGGGVTIYNAKGSVHVVVDLAGYFIIGPAGPKGDTGATGPGGAKGEKGPPVRRGPVAARRCCRGPWSSSTLPRPAATCPSAASPTSPPTPQATALRSPSPASSASSGFGWGRPAAVSR
jgi:hypothetical protein